MFGLKIVPQAHAIVVERLGNFHRVGDSGLNFVIPFLEKIRALHSRSLEVDLNNRRRIIVRSTRLIDLREQILDFPKQSVITQDNVTMEIDAVLYYIVTSPKKTVYGVANLGEAMEKVVQTSLRNVVGQITLDQTLASRETINAKLHLILKEATEPWGVNITRVELQEIAPPKVIRERMELQMTAEREKRAEILRADGKKQATILEAEGAAESTIRQAESIKQAKILEAEGVAQARLTLAKAEAESIEQIEKQLGKDGAQNYMIALKYLESLESISNGLANKIFLPIEATGILGSLSGIGEMFNDSKTTK